MKKSEMREKAIREIDFARLNLSKSESGYWATRNQEFYCGVIRAYEALGLISEKESHDFALEAINISCAIRNNESEVK